MEDVEQIARDRLPVLRDALLVHAPLERRDQLVAVLLDHEADQLLADRPRPAEGKHPSGVVEVGGKKNQQVSNSALTAQKRERVRTCVTYKLACMTRNGFSAFARLAFGLSKKSFTSPSVAWRKFGPPSSGGM